ncbi:sensor histidine kinase [Moorena bouillonii]|uniref:Signal transduction histidine kinase internal region domain-containing protein n=1 Tax=Moorena bouillonii PNG TaxID=568701 RepID=A0A1U7N2E7_9CYAN|nr:histidine kinase [Moorena bouillonii]OLT60128.1 hypothetical protein BJP37_14955 [Moorena bouillonii PNG]
MSIYYTGAFFTVDFRSYALKWIGELFVVILLWIIIRWLYFELLKRKSGLKNIRLRLLIIPLFLIPYSLIGIWFIEDIQSYFDWPYPEFQDPVAGVQLITGAVIFFVNIGFYEALHLFVELKDTKLREEQHKKETITTQLLNLKNQVSPHFLFNSLNTLVYLIDTDKEKSKEFVHSLSNIYERVLEFSDKDLVMLKDELDYINDYIDLLKKRYGDNLKFDFKITKDAMQKMIVPLSIQTGIENAVKHNVVSRKKPLLINVLNSKDYLIINNNLQKKEVAPKGGGQGLRNIKNRYRLLSNKDMLAEETNSGFKLKLPLIESNN